MEKDRFVTIWEYANPPSPTREDDILKVCSMYLGGAPRSDEANSKLKAAITKLLSEGDNTSEKVLSRIVEENNDLSRLLAESGETKVVSSGLRTILDQDLAEDDENDSSVGEDDEEETSRTGMTILMRGFLKMKDNKLEWSGNWAMSTEAFDAGEKAKFRYEMRGDASLVEKDGKIVAPPAAAVFDGSFLVKDQAAPNGFIRMDETGVQFAFEPADQEVLKWKITGKGENVGGEFTLNGELDGASRRLAVFKTYKYKKSDDGSSADSDSEVEDDEEAIDPTELEDLKADQRESFGMVLGEEDDSSNAKAKKKKRRMVEE